MDRDSGIALLERFINDHDQGAKTLTDAAPAIETLRIYAARLASAVRPLSPAAADHVDRARVALEDGYMTTRVQGADPPK